MKTLPPSLRLVAVRLLILALCLAALSAPSWAQTVTTSIKLGWTAPTTNTDGSAITGTLAYQIYQGPKAGPFVAVGSPVTGTTTVMTSASAGNCFAVLTAETLGASTTASALSPTACAEIPNGATGLTISFTVTIS